MKKWSKWPKTRPNTSVFLVSIFGNYTDTEAGPMSDTDTKNIPKYSVFYFRDRRYNFAKLLKNPKLLEKRKTLVQTTYLGSLLSQTFQLS